MAAGTPTTLIARLKKAKRLPSPPGTALRVLELCRQEDVQVQDIADAIMSDPALSARLLKYAHSSLLGVGRNVTSVRHAVLLLGLRTVKLTALGFSLAAPGFQPCCPEFHLPQFWAESFLTAVTARRLATEGFGVDREEAFTAGLLSQIGRLALAQSLPEEYHKVLLLVRGGQELAEAEREVLGTDHAHFAAELLAEWQLPDLLVQAVAQQGAAGDDGTPTRPPLAQVVHLATLLVPGFGLNGRPSPAARDRARAALAEHLRLDENVWQRLVEEIKSDYQQVAQLFDMQLETEIDVFDLYAEAQEEASKVGMVAQLERARILEENRALLKQATTDPLTGIANRAKLEDRFDELVAGARRGLGHFAVIMFDIDHFKHFNDTHGHPVGDLVLKSVAQTVHGTLRAVDLLARYGGEEFVILAPCPDRRGACVVAARTCKSIEQMIVPDESGDLRVTISVGLALSSDYPAVPDPSRLISDADRQLYLSKEAGRNTWSYLERTAPRQAANATAAGAC